MIRKAILTAVAAATLIPAAAMAQSYGDAPRDRADMRHADRRHDDARAHDDRRDARQDGRADRREAREDWRDYRDAHRDVYRMPRYAGPRGYAYRPVVVGNRWDPAYYGQRYWIADPVRYRLPLGARDERWVRYGSDVVLVNIRTGRILRSYTGFFY